jgi:3-deoxy-D-manno-octulosonate 8-phosphate phosphatase (KDO 8-P phosphatase)
LPESTKIKTMDITEKIFTGLGGRFVTPFNRFKTKASRINAFVFDWDGVFNSGIKASDEGSPFLEPDSMGLNMLRLNYYLVHGKVPPVFIITGENNKTAVTFARRENLNSVFLSFTNKTEALDIICKEYGLEDDEIAFMFDDILDFGAARRTGMTFLVKHPGNPLTKDFVVSNNICDYVTGNSGDSEAVREVCELMIGITGDMGKTIETRIRFEGTYKEYLAERGKIETSLHKQ